MFFFYTRSRVSDIAPCEMIWCLDTLISVFSMSQNHWKSVFRENLVLMFFWPPETISTKVIRFSIGRNKATCISISTDFSSTDNRHKSHFSMADKSNSFSWSTGSSRFWSDWLSRISLWELEWVGTTVIWIWETRSTNGMGARATDPTHLNRTKSYPFDLRSWNSEWKRDHLVRRDQSTNDEPEFQHGIQRATALLVSNNKGIKQEYHYRCKLEWHVDIVMIWIIFSIELTLILLWFL